MAYDYKTQRVELFTEDGVKTLTAVRDKAFELCRLAGAFQAEKAMMGVGGGSTWTMLAVLDYLVENKELVEVTAPDSCWAQHRIFRRCL